MDAMGAVKTTVLVAITVALADAKTFALGAIMDAQELANLHQEDKYSLKKGVLYCTGYSLLELFY